MGVTEELAKAQGLLASGDLAGLLRHLRAHGETLPLDQVARLLAGLRAADPPGFSRAAVDSSRLRAMKGGEAAGPSPAGRGTVGSRHQAAAGARGIPLATILADGNRNNVTRLLPPIQAAPPIRGKRRRPRRRPDRLDADGGHDLYRDQVRAVQITPVIARRGTGHGCGPGVRRRVVEGTPALPRWLPRLRIRWEIRDDIDYAFVILDWAIICSRRLRSHSRCQES